MRRKWIWILVVLVVGLAGICIAYSVPARLRAMGQLREWFRRDTFSASVDGSVGDASFQALVFRERIGGEDYYGLKLGELAVYYHEDGLYFDNGRGYDLSGLIPDEMEDWEQWLWVLLLAEFEQLPVGDSTVCRFRIPEARLPSGKLSVPELTLTEDGSGLVSVELQFAGGSVRAVPTEQESIPTEVLMVMMAENTTDVEEILPLIRGCMALGQQDAVGAEVHLKLECGPLPISDAAQLYCSGGRLWFLRSGKALELKLPDVDGQELFAGLGLLLCRDSSISHENGQTVYTLTIPPDQVKKLFDQCLPEAAGLTLSFQEAVCRIWAEEDRITRAELSCEGTMPFLITSLPIRFSMEVRIMEGSPALPPELAE